MNLTLDFDNFTKTKQIHFKVADIFCGAGGLSYGFSQSDFFKLVFANDCDKDALTTYSLNHNTAEILHCDIKDIDKKCF